MSKEIIEKTKKSYSLYMQLQKQSIAKQRNSSQKHLDYQHILDMLTRKKK